MTDEAKRLVDTLRNSTECCKRYARDPYLALAGIMALSADMIEKLSADLENNERQARENFEVSSKALANVAADRDAWKRRAEAAERDMGRMIPCYTCKAQPVGEAPECDGCEAKPSEEWKRSHYAWRGPCAENGGTDWHEQVYLNLMQRQVATIQHDMISCETCRLYGKCGREQADGLECCDGWENGGAR